MMRHVLTTVVVLVALVAGCDSDVVDVNDMTKDETLVGRWTLDCDSASEGRTEINKMEDGLISGTARIVESFEYCWGYDGNDGFGDFTFQQHTDYCGFVFKGKVQPSMREFEGK